MRCRCKDKCICKGCLQESLILLNLVASTRVTLKHAKHKHDTVGQKEGAVSGLKHHRGLFKGGNRMGGFHTAVRGTMFVRKGAVTPGPSRERDITFFVKGRPKSAQQLRDCRFPPPLKMPDTNLRNGAYFTPSRTHHWFCLWPIWLHLEGD